MAGRTKRVHLTKTMIEKLAPPAKGRAFLWDDDPPGFGVIITPNGIKSYIIDYTTRDGTRRRLVLGRCDRMSLEQARIDACGKLSSADLGGDPVAERKTGRLKQRMDDLLDDYINIEMPTRKKQSTIDLHKSQIEKYIRPEFGSMAIIDITDEQIAKLHRETAAKAAKLPKGKGSKGGSAGQGGKVAANRVLAIMSAIMSYAMRQKIRPDNPCKGVEKFKEAGRTRYLNETELQALAHELAGKLAGRFVPAHRIRGSIDVLNFPI